MLGIKCGDHDRAPLRQVAADEIGGKRRSRPLWSDGRNERKRVDELVHDEREQKMTTVRMPGIEIGKTTRVRVSIRDAPSTRAASSSSCGIVLKKPISSHVENGTVNDG